MIDRNNHLVEKSSPLNTLAVKIADDFILQYYSVRQYYPESLYRFYREDSLLTLVENERDKSLVGRNEIKIFFDQFGYSKCQSVALAHSAQYISSDVVLILLSCEISNSDQPPRRCCEVFSLIKCHSDCFYVKNHIIHYQDDYAAPEYNVFEENISEKNVSSVRMEHIVTTTANVSEYDQPALSSPLQVEDHRSYESDYGLQSEDNNIQEYETCPNQEMEFISNSSKTVHSVKSESNEVYLPNNSQPQHPYESTHYDDAPNEDTNNNAKFNNPVNKTWASIAKTGDNHQIISKNNKIGFVIEQETKKEEFQQPVSTKKFPNKNQQPNSDESNLSGSVMRASYHGKQFASSSSKDYRPDSDLSGGRTQGGAGGGNSGRNLTGANFDNVLPSQLFVGNIPVNCSEEELQNKLSEFGKVLDLYFIQSRKNENDKSSHFLKCACVKMETDVSCSQILKVKPFLIRNGHALNIQPFIQKQNRFKK